MHTLGAGAARAGGAVAAAVGAARPACFTTG
jgi:hypothetical protein